MAVIAEERFTELMKEWDEVDLRQLAIDFKRLQESYNAAKDVSALIYAEFELLRKRVIPNRMEEMGLETAKYAGIGRIQIGQQLSAKQLNKAALQEWLVAQGHGSLVASTVNSSSLSAFIKAQIADGEPIPDDDIIEISTFEVASVVKA